MDWIGLILSLWGYYLIGKKNVRGFSITIMGSLFWICYAAIFELWALIVANILFIIISANALSEWEPEEESKDGK